MFDAFGFRWKRTLVPSKIPKHSIERVCFRFHRMLPEFVWDASMLEGNPFSFPEVKTLLEGITVGGKKVSDQEQVLNLAESSKQVLLMVRNRQFAINKSVFTGIHRLVARNEALEWGVFRGEGDETSYTPGVALGEHGQYLPIPTSPLAPELNRVFQSSLPLFGECQPFERAVCFFLFGALRQFFFDGNKRASRLMMNGVLMSNGIDAISVPAAKAEEFNEKMVRFYLTKEGAEMIDFLVDCHPDAQLIRDTNFGRTDDGSGWKHSDPPDISGEAPGS